MLHTETRVCDREGEEKEFIISIDTEKKFAECEHENAISCYYMLGINYVESGESFPGGLVKGKGYFRICPECGAFQGPSHEYEPLENWNDPGK